jgi:hypothetical protein
MFVTYSHNVGFLVIVEDASFFSKTSCFDDEKKPWHTRGMPCATPKTMENIGAIKFLQSTAHD